MNAVIGRMLWKEYCALRMVWIACALGVLFINAVITVSAAAYRWQAFFGVFWGLAMVVPAAYVVACTAMTFAGEREDRTSDWLVALAPPFASLYVSKQAYILLSGLAMQLFLAIAAACFTLADRTVSQGLIPQDSVWDTLRVSEFVFLECLVWGTFWSLQTGKAVNAIFKTIATLIVIFVVSGFTMDIAQMRGAGANGFWYGAFETFGWLRSAWTLGIIAASVALGRKWLDGRGIEWETMLAGWFRRRVTKPRAAVLKRGEPWQRAWQRLWWLERQSLTAFGWMTLAAAMLSAISILFGQRPTLAWMMAFGCLLILIGGLMSWRGEQARNQYHLLVNYGAAPLGLWANKLLMWFVATVIAVAVVALPTIAFWEVLSAMYPKTSAATSFERKWPSLFPLVDRFGHQPAMLIATTTAMTLYALMMFATAFLWSLLCRKGVIAFGMTLVTLCVLTPWYGVVTELGLPMWLFLAPLPVWLLAISYRHLTAWWLDRTGWRVWLPRAMEFAVVPAVLMLGAIAYRVYEIPWVDFDKIVNEPSMDATLRSGDDAAWRRVTAAVRALPPMTTATALINMHPVDAPPINLDEEMQANFNQWIKDNDSKLEELRDALISTKGLMAPEAAIGLQLNNQPQWNTAEASLARKAVRTENLDESVSWLQAAARLAGAARRYVPFHTQQALASGDLLLFDAMIVWAQRPDQTEDSLRKGLAACAHELRLWRNYSGDVRANWDALRSNPPFAEYWSWEEARQQRLLQIAAVNQATYLREVQTLQRAASLNPVKLPVWSQSDVAWQVQPADARWRNAYLGVAPVIGLDEATVTMLHQAETRYRATVTIMGIVGYRRVHGRLPVSLVEVEPLFPSDKQNRQEDIFHDPYARGWFHYEPVGLFGPNQSADESLKGPLLRSAGPKHYVLATDPYGLRTGLVATAAGTTDHQPLSGQRDFAANYIFPVPPQSE